MLHNCSIVIGLLGGWLVIIPLLAFPITAIFALIIQARLRDTVQKSLALGAERQALLRRHFKWLTQSLLDRAVLWWAPEARIRRLIHVEGDIGLAERAWQTERGGQWDKGKSYDTFAPIGAWLVATPHLPFKANGSGDVTAALFTAHYRSSGSAATALARTTASVFELLQMTLQSGARELQLVQAQQAYVHPRQTFEVRQVR